MKKTKRLFCALLALLMLGGCVACKGGGEAADGTTGADESSTAEPLPEGGLLICSPTEAPYTIVWPSDTDETVKGAAVTLRRTLVELTGNQDVPIREDWVKDLAEADNDRFEILVGATNRPESAVAAAALPGKLDFSITVIENKIVICADDSSRVADAVTHFLSLLTVTETEEGKTLRYEAGRELIVNYVYPLADTLMGGEKLSGARIVLSAAASDNEKALASSLAAYLARTTGVEPPVVTDASPVSGAEIVIGQTNRGNFDLVIPSGQYLVRLTGKTLFVQATEPSVYYGAAPEVERLISEGKLAADFSELLTAGISLNGKKVMFIGNSMLYYGNCVINGNQSSADLGYFYQLCRANGEKCTVYDCTFGSHGLREFISKCDADHHSADHLASYDLDSVDYVVMCQVTEKDGLVQIIKQIQKRFPNPKTKFIYLCCTYTYQQNHQSVISQLPAMQKAGITVVNVGELCYNVWKGNTKVPGGSLSYNKSSFIVNKKDQNHPNMLTGYIEALMCYCAITGKSAVGQPYAFATDKSIQSAFNTSTFISNYYTPNSTNFDKVFASADEMEGLQKLIDQTNEKWGANVGMPQ